MSQSSLRFPNLSSRRAAANGCGGFKVAAQRTALTYGKALPSKLSIQIPNVRSQPGLVGSFVGTYKYLYNWG